MRYKTRRQQRYHFLRENWMTPAEARAFSVLPRNTPALRMLVNDRRARRNRFNVIAQRKVERGSWGYGDIDKKWRANLKRYYRRSHWLVQEGPTGKQKGPLKGALSPWAMYRDYERSAPDKQYLSPWEIKQLREGRTPFDRGQLFIQKQASAERDGDYVSHGQMRQWVRDLTRTIRGLRGERREKLVAQRSYFLNKLGQELREVL